MALILHTNVCFEMMKLCVIPVSGPRAEAGLLVSTPVDCLILTA